jgi:predicted  nucleic acid-binding Zn-ribbon protein
VREKLLALNDLQKLDAEIAALRKTAETYPVQLEALKKELAAAAGVVQAERARLGELENQRKTLEQNIQDDKEKVKKWEQRLADQRTTREYSALAREIDIAKKATVTMSEEVNELGRQVTVTREAVKAKEAEFAGHNDRIGGQVQELQDRLAAVDGQAKGLEQSRAASAAHVDRELLTRYDSVRRKRMPALVPVVAGACQGCRMMVRPQLYNTLRVTLGTDLCPSCGRIIYAAEAVELPKPPAEKA